MSETLKFLQYLIALGLFTMGLFKAKTSMEISLAAIAYIALMTVAP